MPNTNFNDQQKRIIRKMLWILFSLFILVSAIGILSHFFPEIKEFDKIDDFISTYLFNGILIILCLVFSPVFSGLFFLKFVKIENVNFLIK